MEHKMEYLNGHIVPTSPVSPASSLRLVSDEYAKEVMEDWNVEEAIEKVKLRLIVKASMDSKVRETQAPFQSLGVDNDNSNS